MVSVAYCTAPTQQDKGGEGVEAARSGHDLALPLVQNDKHTNWCIRLWILVSKKNNYISLNPRSVDEGLCEKIHRITGILPIEEEDRPVARGQMDCFLRSTYVVTWLVNGVENLHPVIENVVGLRQESSLRSQGLNI